MDRKKDAPVVWSVEYSSPPSVMRHCKKCGKKSEYVSSGEFRVNAQQKKLDIWLIYKCVHCNTTWNSTIFSRISPHRLGSSLLEQFHNNDEGLAIQYAMDSALLKKNGVEIKTPDYQIIGEDVSLEKTVQIKIESRYSFPLKISSVLRTKLGLSQRELSGLISSNRLQCNTKDDLYKKKLLSSDTVITISQ